MSIDHKACAATISGRAVGRPRAGKLLLVAVVLDMVALARECCDSATLKLSKMSSVKQTITVNATPSSIRRRKYCHKVGKAGWCDVVDIVDGKRIELSSSRFGQPGQY